MAEHQAERDYPIGHPKAVDYDGEPYTPPPPPLGRDWPVGHPKAADSPQSIAEAETRAADLERLHLEVSGETTAESGETSAETQQEQG